MGKMKDTNIMEVKQIFKFRNIWAAKMKKQI